MGAPAWGGGDALPALTPDPLRSLPPSTRPASELGLSTDIQMDIFRIIRVLSRVYFLRNPQQLPLLPRIITSFVEDNFGQN